MSDLEARIAEVLGAHKKKLGIRDGKRHCICGWAATGLLADELYEQHQGDQLAALIREREAEASAQAFQAVRDNAEYEPEERDGVYLISPATLWITVDKLNALDTNHDGMDWVRYTATDYANSITDAKVEALREAADSLPDHSRERMSIGYWLRARADNLEAPNASNT